MGGGAVSNVSRDPWRVHLGDANSTIAPTPPTSSSLLTHRDTIFASLILLYSTLLHCLHLEFRLSFIVAERRQCRKMGKLIRLELFSMQSSKSATRSMANLNQISNLTRVTMSYSLAMPISLPSLDPTGPGSRIRSFSHLIPQVYCR